MKNQWKFWLMGLFVVGMFLTACDDDDDNGIQPKDEETVYTLNELNGSGVSGTVTFRRVDDATTRVTIALTGTEEGNTHPAHIHSGDAAAGGPIVLDLTSVNGATGRSETMVTELNDGTAITYEELIKFDGHVNVHQSAADLATMIAQGNIGSNAQADGGGNY